MIPLDSVQVGSNDDNSSGGGYAYRASKAALNISAPRANHDLPSVQQFGVRPGHPFPKQLNGMRDYMQHPVQYQDCRNHFRTCAGRKLITCGIRWHHMFQP